MTVITLNKPLPAFTFQSTDSALSHFSDLLGHNLVIYFYPKDDTPGCTQEGLDFSQQQPQFKHYQTQIIGISRDTIRCHTKFIDKFSFAFPLIADTDERLCQAFEVIKEKNMYGKKVMGIERSTFLIDKKGVLRNIWRKVKVDNHVNEVLEAVKALELKK